MTYEVGETQPANLVALFGRGQDAMALVCDAVATHGEAYVRSLALVGEDETGRSATIAVADQLLARARVPA